MYNYCINGIRIQFCIGLKGALRIFKNFPEMVANFLNNYLCLQTFSLLACIMQAASVRLLKRCCKIMGGCAMVRMHVQTQAEDIIENRYGKNTQAPDHRNQGCC